MMDYSIDQYIAVYKNVFPLGFCEHVISMFQQAKDQGLCFDRRTAEGANELYKNDLSLYVSSPSPLLGYFNGAPAEDIFWEGMQRCYNIYACTFPVLQQSCSSSTSRIKIQETSSQGGYHVWHCEHDIREPLRNIVYSVYLNTLPTEACGETEFLHQERRISPVENTVVLWPASFTHTHRGNPVYGNTKKYIATGWFTLN